MGAGPDRNVYRELQEHLDRMPVGFPATSSGVEIRILQRLFTPDEAELALELSAIPEPLETVHARVRVRLSVEALRAILNDMVSKGLILRVGDGDRARYGKLPFVVGIYERQLTRLTADFERDAQQYAREAFGQALHATPTTQLRTVPVNLPVSVPRAVATHDDIRSYVRSAEGPFAAMACICRHGRRLLDQPCAQSTAEANCLTIGRGATAMVESGAARFITRDEMLQRLEDADREGLVLQPENTRSPLFVCCCCGCCCGVLTTAKRLPEPARFFNTNFYAEVSVERCEACGTCFSRCQMDAVSLETGTATVRRSHCIGCGLCVTTCQSGAMRLVPMETRRTPPEDTAALYTRLFQERFGVVGTVHAAVRTFFGRKV
jgi:NAD-dependent dihydropyrimidine dehydrogenase PreA subunit